PLFLHVSLAPDAPEPAPAFDPPAVQGKRRHFPASGSKLPHLFSAPTKNSPGARDLSRRNAGKTDPRLEISRLLRRPIFLWTKVRAPFARPANTLNTYPASCRQNGTMRHATVCRQDAGSTFGVTFRPPLN